MIESLLKRGTLVAVVVVMTLLLGIVAATRVPVQMIDLCGLPENPNAERSGYPLEGHSIKPLLLDPEGGWDGPEVAIMALPGKDHSQLKEHVGTLYPHFSVRSKDWRYSLTSDGQEELYHYPSDPHEFTNLADDRSGAD